MVKRGGALDGAVPTRRWLVMDIKLTRGRVGTARL